MSDDHNNEITQLSEVKWQKYIPLITNTRNKDKQYVHCYVLNMSVFSLDVELIPWLNPFLVGYTLP